MAWKTDMSLMLDARQRAMLEEMGVKVWWPANAPVVTAPDAADTAPATDAQPVAATAPQARSADAAPTARLPAADPVPTQPAPSTAPAARAASPADDGPPPWMDEVPPDDGFQSVAEPPRPHEADAGQASARRPAAPPPRAPAPTPAAARPTTAAAPTVRLEAARRLYAPAAGADDGAPTGGWLVLVDMPPGADGRHGDAFAGEAGRLLDQMLRALRLHAGPAPVHLQRVHRPAPGVPVGEDDAPFDAGFATACRELAPRMVLALGPLAAQQLLGGQPLGRLRAQVGSCGDGPTAVVASYAPAYLLRTPADKGRAWADLCLAAAEFDRLAAAHP